MDYIASLDCLPRVNSQSFHRYDQKRSFACIVLKLRVEVGIDLMGHFPILLCCKLLVAHGWTFGKPGD
jgi:hypothetical protein